MPKALLTVDRCAGCGTPASLRAVRCANCEAELRPAQRRLVTVLFADLAGYTTLCEGRDPEDVQALVRPVMVGLRELCEAHHGIVPAIEGDGFMAAFGAMKAREDDPRLALAAAAEMQQFMRAHGQRLPDVRGLHVGVHVGEVVVSPARERVGFALTGDAVNVAARLCSCAQPGEVLVTTALVDLVPRLSGFGEVEVVQLRGRVEPTAYRRYDWTNAVGTLERRPSLDRTPYVPRRAIQAELDEGLDAGQSLLLVGEAGSGKSRLAQWAVSNRPAYTASCGDYHYPRVRDLLADLLGRAVGEVPVVRVLRGEGGVGTQEAPVLRAAAVLLASRAGQVVVLEEADRLPESELALLRELLDASPVPWLVTSRHALDVGLRQVNVAGLAPDEAAAMLQHLLPEASPELSAQVLQRAGDSPLFLEQCTRLLIESGALETAFDRQAVATAEALRTVPTSMRLFVSSRLDLLSVEDRRRLGIASVLGEAIDVDLLCHLAHCSEQDLDELVARGLLRGETDGAAGRLRFAHALVRDVTYATLLRAQRVEIHRAAAEWYAALPASQVLEAQAFHLEAAVRLGDSDCELVARTVEALVLHARSVEVERVQVAEASLRRARELVDGRGECSIPTLGLDLASSSVSCALGRFDEARALAARAGAAADSAEDREAKAEAVLLLARSNGASARAESLRGYEEAGALYAELDDRVGVARAEAEAALMEASDTGLVGYVESLERAFQAARRGGDRRLQSSAAQDLAVHHAVVTGRAASLEWSQTALAVSRSDDVTLQPRLDLAVAALAMFGCRPAEGLAAGSRALASARSMGLSHVLTNAYTTVLDLLIQDGQLEQAARELVAAREFASRRNGPWWQVQLDLQQARLLQRSGRIAQAHELLERLGAGDATELAILRRDLAETTAMIELDRGEFSAARAQAVQAVLLDDQTGERCPQLRPRLIELVATLAMGERVPLTDISALRTLARETGLMGVAGLAARWVYVDELRHGWAVDLHGLEAMTDVIEARALDLEIEALSTGRFELLLDAAAVWAELGTTVWQARALLWHSELAGAAHPETDTLLETLMSPPGLAELLRAQVRGLRG